MAPYFDFLCQPVIFADVKILSTANAAEGVD
jgi:hypothetical protein